MANTPDKVLKIAKAELGYYEKSSSAYKKNPNVLNDKVNGAGYDNYTKYGKEMHDLYPIVMDFPAPYCDAFVDWCFYKAYGISTAKKLLHGDFDDYTVASATMYAKHNALYKEPEVGDQPFFTKNGNVSGCYHTGLVYKVDGTYFYTYEANTSSANSVVANGGGVFAKKYFIAQYRGKVLFGRPKYDKTKKTTYKGTFPTLPTRGYFDKYDRGEQARLLQLLLNWITNDDIEVDGYIGEESLNCVGHAQKILGFKNKEVDCLWGAKTQKKAKSYKK